MDPKILVVDTETNGRDPAEVIELACVGVKEGSWGSNSFRFYGRYEPMKPSTVGALSVHHILAEELEGFFPSSAAELPLEAQYIIGHNVDYDWKALGSPNVKRICTLALSRWNYPELDSHRLGAMIYHLCEHGEARRLLKSAHTAEADAEMSLMILQGILKDKNLSFSSAEDLWIFSEECRIPKTITFGMHAGKLIADIPHGYMMWCMKQPGFDPYVIKAMKRILGVV